MAHELLSLHEVGKDYPTFHKSGGRLRIVADLLRGRGISDYYRALDHVSFTLRDGESIGIIGENGAGKSTLLKIIAGVIKPSRGIVHVRGRIGALLELGSGFHPEYTGLENIDLAAALLGMSAGEIRRKRDDIIAFADIGDHITQPLKHYSSGMVVRLGFAVVTALRPDILITDEVLAVGDESFQKKCMAWMEAFLGNGTMLLCSHNMFHIRKLCRYALWLKNGSVPMLGMASDVVQAYLAYHEERAAKEKAPPELAVLQAAGCYALRELWLQGREDAECANLRHGDDLIVEGELFSPDDRAPGVTVGLVRADGTPIYGIVSDMDGYVPTRVAPRTYRFRLRFPALHVLPGKYTVRGHAMDPEGMRLFDTLERPLSIDGDTRELGLCHLPHEWEPGRTLAEQSS